MRILVVSALALSLGGCGMIGGSEAGNQAAQVSAPATPEVSAPKKSEGTLVEAAKQAPKSDNVNLLADIAKCVHKSYGGKGPSPEKMAESREKIRSLFAKGDAGLKECKAA